MIKDKKFIYVCSKLRGDIDRNIIKANIYCRFVYELGHIPLAPHVIFTQFLDDEKKSERVDGMAMGKHLMKCCDEMWVFGLDISKGMQAEIDEAINNGIKIRRFNSDMEEI